MFKRIILISSLLSLGAANADQGAYIGANIGYTNIANWWTGAMALTLNGGYAFDKYFATEAGFTWIYPIAIQYPSNSGLSGSYSAGQSFLDVAAKGSIPLSDIFNLYAKLGLGAGFAYNSAYSYNGWNAPAGVSPGIYMAMGGEFKLSRHFDLTVEDYGLIPFAGNNYGNINVLGAGVKYNF